jgi:hypothetical protein
MHLDPGLIFLLIVAVVLIVILIALFGGGMAGGMAMMAGMVGTPVGWIALIIIGLIALGGSLYFFAGV